MFEGHQTEHLVAQYLMDYPPLQSHAPRMANSCSLALAKPAGHTLSSIKIFQTCPLILIRSSTVSE